MRSESSALSLHHIKTTVSLSFWYSRVSASLPSVRESERRNAVLRFQVGITKADTNVSAFWYSRIAASLPSVRESGCVNSRSILRRDSKSRHKSVCFLVLPCISELAERTGIGTTIGVLRFQVGVKKTTEKNQSFLVLPTGIEPITNP